VVGQAALDWVDQQQDLVGRVADALKAAPADIAGRVIQLAEDKKALERELSETRKKLAMGGGGSAAPANKQIAGITFAGRVLDGVPAKDLKSMADEVKKQVESGVIALISSADGKASVVVAVTADLIDRVNAVDLVRAGSEAMGGKGGGGRPDMAQAGGPDPSRAEEALAAIEQAIAAATTAAVA